MAINPEKILKYYRKSRKFLLPTVNIEGNKKVNKLAKQPTQAKSNNDGKNKNTALLDKNAIADFKLRGKLYLKKSQICKINADRLITKTITKT